MKQLKDYFPTRLDYFITIQGEPLLSIFIEQCQDGIITGIGVKGLGDVHITNLDKNGRMSWHITDKTTGNEVSKEQKNPYGGHQPKKSFTNKYEKMMKEYLVPYHPNRKVWVVSPDYLIKLTGQAATDNVNTIPLELILGKIEFDPRDGTKWMKIRIRELWSYRVPFGIIIEEDKIKYVRPLDVSLMFCFTWRQLGSLIDKLMALFGFDEYMEYLKDEKDVHTIIQNLIEGQTNQFEKSV